MSESEIEDKTIRRLVDDIQIIVSKEKGKLVISALSTCLTIAVYQLSVDGKHFDLLEEISNKIKEVFKILDQKGKK